LRIRVLFGPSERDTANPALRECGAALKAGICRGAVNVEEASSGNDGEQ